MKIIKHNGRIEIRNDKDELHSFNDKPAIRYSNGDKEWYKENKRHRLDGPAIEWNNGHNSWYYEGKKIECFSIEEFLKIINLKVFW